MIKKLLSVLLIFSMTISLFACGKTTTATISATSATEENFNNDIEEVKKANEDNIANDSNIIKSNGYSIGDSIYILGVIDNTYGYNTQFSEGLADVCKKENYDYKHGYIDRTGNLAIDYAYDFAQDFSEGLAAVALGGEDAQKWGYIDKNGKLVIDYKFAEAAPFSEGLAAVLNNITADGKYGYIDKNGKLVIDFVYDWALNFSEGLASVYVNNKWGYIDKNGKLVIDYGDGDGGDFSEGLAAVSNDNNKWGYIDKNGKLVIDYAYDSAGSFSEGLARVGLGGQNGNYKWGYIDKNGKLVIDYAYDFAQDFLEGLAAVGLGQDGEYKYGYIDKNGKLVIDCVYDWFSDFSEGLAVVSTDNSDGYGYGNGYIDKNGNFVIKPVFNALSKFSEGIALGQYNDKAILLTYLDPYTLGYTSNQLLNAKNILLANDTDGFFTEYYNSLEKSKPNWIINTSNWNDNDYKKDLEKTIKEKEIKPNTWYVTEAGIWYYFEDDRTTKKTGWYKDPEDNQTYYLQPETGIMATGWTEIDGDMYYFNDQHGNDPNWFYNAEKDIWASAGKDVKSYGSMYRDEETPDGKRVDVEGRLIE